MTKKEIEKKVDEVFYKHASGVQFKIMDLSKMIEDGIRNGTDGVKECKQAVEKYGVTSNG